MLPILGIILALALFVFLAFKNLNLTVVTLLASLVIIITSGLNLWEAYSQFYASGFKNFIGNMFMVFLISSIFGKILDESGGAKRMAYAVVNYFGTKSTQVIVLAVFVVSLIFSFCGMGLAGIFTTFPIYMSMFKAAHIPRKYYPGMGMAIGGTVGCVIPGSPAATNLVAANACGTTIYAAPVLGFITCAFMFGLNWIYFIWSINRSRQRGEDFIDIPGEDYLDLNDTEAIKALPSAGQAFLPVIVLIIGAFAFQTLTGNSTFAVVISLTVGIVLMLIMWHKRINIKNCCQVGINNGGAALVLMGSVSGFGAVVTNTQAYQDALAAIFSMNISPLVTTAVSINVIAALLASNTNSVNLFCSTLAQSFLAQGVNPQLLHRTIIQSGIGFDAMPYASGIQLNTTLCKSPLKESYPMVFVSQVIVPVLAIPIVIILGSMGIL